MTDLSNEIQSEIASLKEHLPDGPYLINDFINTTEKYSILLSSENTQPIGIEKKERRFALKEPTYIRRIQLTGNPQKISSDIEITLTTTSNKRSIPKITKSAETTATCIVNEFITEFSIQSNHTLIKPHITKIEVIGYTLNNLSEVASKIQETITTKYNIETLTQKYSQELQETQEKIKSNEAKVRELTEQTIQLTNQKKDITENLEELIESQSELAAQLKETNTEISTQTGILSGIQNNCDQLKQQAKELNQSISTKKSELNQIINDRNLISDEYKDYVKEGKGQSRIYTALAAISLSAIIFCVYELYNGASALLQTQHENFIDIISSLTLRIPFAVVFSLGIFYSWNLTKSLFSRIFKIHEDRLTLAKLLVIAKDTVFSATTNLQIDDNLKFQERIKLKIEILKSHLAKDLERDFKYQPTQTKNEQHHSPVSEHPEPEQ